MAKFPCPCCGYQTLEEPPPGSLDICDICLWEDDIAGYETTGDGEGGVPSLKRAQENFAAFGASEERFKADARKPRPDEPRDPAWKPL